MTQPDSITINGNNYAVSSLNEIARAQIANIQAVDAEIARLQVQLGIARTARNAYAAALGGALPAPEAVGEARADAAEPMQPAAKG